jgi:glycosyltransferase involved in cell wall biosynthesis
MHVLLIHQAFASIDEPGGTRHHELARYLVSRGHRVTVITGTRSYMTDAPGASSNRGGRGPDAYGVEIIRCRTYESWHRSFFLRLVSFFSFMAAATWAGLWVGGVDVVWGTSPPIFQAVSAWLVARVRRVRFLLEIRDLWPEFAVAAGVLRQPMLIKMSTWLEGFLYRHSDSLVVNSPGFVEPVRARAGRAPMLVPNGVDPAMFSPEASGRAFRDAHHLGDDFVVLYAGAHGLSNDLSVVLDAAEALRRQPGIRIVMLGDGKEKPKLVAESEARGLANVLFLPSVPKNEIGDALAAADACVAILKPIEAYKITYPNKVFYYMAAGRPVLLAIDGVIRQLVEGSGAGLFVPPGNGEAMAEAISELRRDPEGRLEMGRKGRQAVEQAFNRADLALKMESALAGRSGQGAPRSGAA